MIIDLYLYIDNIKKTEAILLTHIIIFFVQYSTISFSVITFMESKEFIIILNMLVIIGIYLLIPLSSILLKTILKKFQ